MIFELSLLNSLQKEALVVFIEKIDVETPKSTAYPSFSREKFST